MDTVGVAIADMGRVFSRWPKVSFLRPFSCAGTFVATLVAALNGSLLDEAYELLYPEFGAVQLVQQDSLTGTIETGTNYYKILERQTSEDHGDAAVTSWTARLHGSISGPKHGVGLTLNERGFSAEWDLVEGNYTADITQRLRRAIVSVNRYVAAGKVGVHIGGVSSPYAGVEERSPGSIGGFYLEFKKGPVSVAAELLTDQLLHLNQTLTHTRNDNFRTFPLSMRTDNAGIRITALRPKGYASVKTYWSSIGKGTASETEYQMPPTLTLQKGGLLISSGYTSRCTLWVDMRAERWGGFLENPEFLLADSITTRRLAGQLGIRSSNGTHLSGYTDYFYAVSQRGRLDTRPFSSWTLFKRLEYSYRDLDFTWFEPGVEFGHKFRWRKHQMSLEASAAYLRMCVAGNISQIQRIVFIPVATKRYGPRIWGIRALLVNGSLGYSLQVGRLAIGVRVSQRFFGDPFGNAGEGDENNSGGRKNGDSTSGGTRVTGRIRIQL